MSYNRRIRTLINRGLIEATKKKPANGGRSRSIYKITSLGKRLLKIKTKKAEGK
jgi:DNA-binding PadR family transcriptional regulator